MTKKVKLIDATATMKQAVRLFHLLRDRESYSNVIANHLNQPEITDVISPLAKANDEQLRRLGKQLWGPVWGTIDHKHHPMSWRNIHSITIDQAIQKAA